MTTDLLPLPATPPAVTPPGGGAARAQHSGRADFERAVERAVRAAGAASKPGGSSAPPSEAPTGRTARTSTTSAASNDAASTSAEPAEAAPADGEAVEVTPSNDGTVTGDAATAAPPSTPTAPVIVVAPTIEAIVQASNAALAATDGEAPTWTAADRTVAATTTTTTAVGEPTASSPADGAPVDAATDATNGTDGAPTAAADGTGRTGASDSAATADAAATTAESAASKVADSVAPDDDAAADPAGPSAASAPRRATPGDGATPAATDDGDPATPEDATVEAPKMATDVRSSRHPAGPAAPTTADGAATSPATQPSGATAPAPTAVTAATNTPAVDASVAARDAIAAAAVADEANTPKIVGAARLLRHGPGAPSTMTMTLDPAELGRVRVELTAHEGQLAVRLHAEQQRGVQAIGAGLDQLRDALEREGLRLGDVGVGLSGSGSGDGRTGTDDDTGRHASGTVAATALAGAAGVVDDRIDLPAERVVVTADGQLRAEL